MTYFYRLFLPYNNQNDNMFPLPESIIKNEEAGEFPLADMFEDVAKDISNDGQMVGITNNVNEIMLLLHQFSSNDKDKAHEVLQSSSMAISLLKDQLASLQPILSTVTNIEPLLDTLTHELTNAENHLKSIGGFVSEQYTHTKSKDGQRILSSHEVSSRNSRQSSSISKADYHLRAQSRHLHTGNSIGKSDESQQGYHPARQSRRDTGGGGQQHRRLNHANGQCVASAGDTMYGAKLKAEQCIRLAECAQNYNLYDLFVYFFADDIDFDTGSIDKDEKISLSRDLEDIPKKVRTALTLYDMPSFDATMMLTF